MNKSQRHLQFGLRVEFFRSRPVYPSALKSFNSKSSSAESPSTNYRYLQASDHYPLLHHKSL